MVRWAHAIIGEVIIPYGVLYVVESFVGDVIIPTLKKYKLGRDVCVR
jgi:hypothetical protein